MRKVYLYTDNVLVIILSSIINYSAYYSLSSPLNFLLFLINFPLIIGLIFITIQFRFWRTPIRNVNAAKNEIVSPADGKIIYIKEISAGEIPISIKNGKISKIAEITKTDLLSTPCYLIGINMTPFDVHKNCSPIDGKIHLSKHTAGKFLSLKKSSSEIENERNTFVIENQNIKIGVVQIASRRVRRIDSYCKEGDAVAKGQWIGMIRFGSQVDVILPLNCQLKVNVNEQVYAIKTILAEV